MLYGRYPEYADGYDQVAPAGAGSQHPYHHGQGHYSAGAGGSHAYDGRYGGGGQHHQFQTYSAPQHGGAGGPPQHPGGMHSAPGRYGQQHYGYPGSSPHPHHGQHPPAYPEDGPFYPDEAPGQPSNVPPPFAEDGGDGGAYYGADFDPGAGYPPYAEEDPYQSDFIPVPAPDYPPDHSHHGASVGGLRTAQSHYSQTSHYPASAGPPRSIGGGAQSSSSRRGPAPRPPPSVDHHKLRSRRRGDEADEDEETRAEEGGDDDGWEPDPTGARQYAHELSDDSDEGGRMVDPSVTVQRLGKIRQAQQSALPGRGGGAPGSSGVQVQDVPRPPPAAQWQCGKARVKLRQRFNGKEIDVTKIMGQYDTDGDAKLEQDEFLVLLQDYEHWSQHIAQQEVEMVLALADLDHDECIEPNEVLYALKVWFAYCNLPRTAGPILAGISDCALPSAATLREALLVLNEESPVSLEEADYVRHMALALGASEHRVTPKQMRMAISVWYLHVERGATPHGALVQNAFAGAHARICDNNPVQRFCRGHCDPMTLACLGVCFIVWILLPVFAIWIGASTETDQWPCERPMLGFAVSMTGWLALGQAVIVLIATGAWECKALQKLRLCSGIGLAGVTVGLIIIWLMGFWELMTTTPSTCGFLIWEFGNVIWIFVPILCIVFICCGLPCIYCHEYLHNKRIDEGLMADHGKLSDGEE